MTTPQAPAGARRFSIALLALALATSLFPLTSMGAVTESSPAGRAADWIAREYRAADSEIELYGTGTLVDAMLALAATGTEQDAALDMLAELEAEAAAFAGEGDDFDPAAAAKVVLALATYGKDPAATVPGRDFESELRSTLQTEGADAGRFGETTVFGQALAVIALSRTTLGVPTSAVKWLAAAQCEEGDFTFDGTCPGYGDADTTGLVALALLAAGDNSAQGAVAWLESIQLPNGGIPAFGAANANSTGVAAQAFLAAGETELAAAAADFLESLQFGPDAGPADAGGLRYLEADTTANTFATIQGAWGMGVQPLTEVTAPTFDFTDIDGSVFERDIIWIAAAGVTQGCNPPDNDEYCPQDPVTRGQMAAFLRRALELPAASSAGFTDTAASVFAVDIDAIAAAGITRGCNPPDNDHYCPDDPVTRGQMAAFLTRAFDLPGGSGSGFTDIEGSVFVSDIEAIAVAGVTRGCNPPDNDHYCPDDPVTRGEMAAFLHRAMSR